jgi:hypothetical protein
MKKGSITALRRELEDKFFLERDMELLEALREETASKEDKQALSDTSGIVDDDLLCQLVEIQVSHETVAAISLVPLIAVAWADGSIDIGERKAVLAAAAESGVDKQHAGYELLKCWLKNKPDAQLLEIWKNYVATLSLKLDEPSRALLKEGLLGRARTVAKAAGGILGLGNKISDSEQAVLEELERAFD